MRGAIALALGGLAGTFGRVGVSWAVLRLAGASFPWGTLAVNLSGCLAVGWLDGALRVRGLGGEHGRLLFLAGFCGAYTTFSALILELDGLLRAAPLRAASYAAASAVLGLALFRLGSRLGA